MNSSFIFHSNMEPNVLGNTKNIGRAIDGRVVKLENMWESLSNVVKHRGTRTNIQEADKQLRNIQTTVTNIREEMQESKASTGAYIDGMDQFLNDCQSVYDDIMQEMNELEPWLSERGYLPPDTTSSNGDVKKE